MNGAGAVSGSGAIRFIPSGFLGATASISGLSALVFSPNGNLTILDVNRLIEFGKIGQAPDGTMLVAAEVVGDRNFVVAQITNPTEMQVAAEVVGDRSLVLAGTIADAGPFSDATIHRKV